MLEFVLGLQWHAGGTRTVVPFLLQILLSMSVSCTCCSAREVQRPIPTLPVQSELLDNARPRRPRGTPFAQACGAIDVAVAQTCADPSSIAQPYRLGLSGTVIKCSHLFYKGLVEDAVRDIQYLSGRPALAEAQFAWRKVVLWRRCCNITNSCLRRLSSKAKGDCWKDLWTSVSDRHDSNSKHVGNRTQSQRTSL